MTINQIYDNLKDIEYGWVDSNKNKYHKLSSKLLKELYILQSPEEIKISKLGLCWDQVELERVLLIKEKIKYKSLVIYYKHNEKILNHTFILCEFRGNYIWLEHAWEKYKGVHPFVDEETLLNCVKDAFIDLVLSFKFDLNKIVIREYSRPAYNCSYEQFINNFLK